MLQGLLFPLSIDSNQEDSFEIAQLRDEVEKLRELLGQKRVSLARAHALITKLGTKLSTSETLISAELTNEVTQFIRTHIF